MVQDFLYLSRVFIAPRVHCSDMAGSASDDKEKTVLADPPLTKPKTDNASQDDEAMVKKPKRDNRSQDDEAMETKPKTDNTSQDDEAMVDVEQDEDHLGKRHFPGGASLA